MEGTNIPKTVQDLSKERVVTAFTDGDRGGELILRELFQVAEVDFVARAPRAHEVEELSSKQIVKCLRNKVPGDQYMEMNNLNFEEKSFDELDKFEPESDYRNNDRRDRKERDERRDKHDKNREERHNRDERRDRDERRKERFNNEALDKYRKKREERQEKEDREMEIPKEEPVIEEPKEEPEFIEEPAAVEEPVEETVVEIEEKPKKSTKRKKDAIDRPKKSTKRKSIEAEEPIEEPMDDESVVEPEIKEDEPVEEPKEEPVAIEEPVEEEKPKETKKPRSLRGKKLISDKVLTPEQESYRDMLLELSTTHNAKVLDNNNEVIRQVAVKSLVNSLKEDDDDVSAIVFDGVISQRIIDVSSEKGIKTVVGTRKGNISKMPADVTIWTKEDLV